MAQRSGARTRFILVVAALLALTAVPATAAPPPTVDVIVVLEDGPEPPGLVARQVRDAHGARIGAVYTHALSGFAASVPEPALAGLAADPRVAWIEPDVEVSIAQTTSEVIPTGIDRIDADANPMDTSLNLGGNSSVEVAVLDTGIKADHPDLHVVAYSDCTSVIAVEIFGQLILSGSCGADGNPYDEDGHGHGTHVAGTIGAKAGNGLGVVGVAPDVRLWSIKVLGDDGSGGLGGILAGIDLVVSNAHAIAAANMSFGFEGTSAALDTAVTNAVDAGVVFVAAAGNSAIDVAGFSPANGPDALAVSALNDRDGLPGGLDNTTDCYLPDPDDTLAPFSNFGAGIDLAAPGTCILSTYNTGGYAWGSGTSMAAPHVTGAIARHIAEQEAANGAFPNDRSGVNAILSGFFADYTVPASDPVGFTDDSGDGIAEPLLYLGYGATPVPNRPPVAGFTWSCPDLTCSFTNTSSDPDGDPLTYSWDFGDGNGSTADSPGHTYAAGGEYTVTLTASDGEVSDTASETFTVTTANQPPVAGFTWSCPDLTCSFTNTSSDPDGDPLTYSWDFGDGNGSTADSPGHTYATGGEYTVTLTASDGEVSDTASETFTVTEPSVFVHVGDLDGVGVPGDRGRWDAEVTITVHDESEGPVSGSTVSGVWSDGASGSVECATDGAGTCTVTKQNLKGNASPVTFTVTGVTGSSMMYDVGSNHDPDGDSNGTTISVAKDQGGTTAPPPSGAAVHVDGLTGTASGLDARGRWEATVTITVAEADGSAVAGILVDGTWSDAAKGSGSCTTDSFGVCTVSKGNLKSDAGPATFTVDLLSGDGYAYDSGSNFADSVSVSPPGTVGRFRAE